MNCQLTQNPANNYILWVSIKVCASETRETMVADLLMAKKIECIRRTADQNTHGHLNSAMPSADIDHTSEVYSQNMETSELLKKHIVVEDCKNLACIRSMKGLSVNGCLACQTCRRKRWLKALIKATLFKSSFRIMGPYKCQKQLPIYHDKAAMVKHVNHFWKKRANSKGRNKQFVADLGVTKKLCRESSKVLLPGMVEEINMNAIKYWYRRYCLFSRFDQGIKMDEEGLFSVTPERIASHQAAQCGSGIVVDAFTGVGGNAIQFALINLHVIAIDIDPRKIEYAQHNARIYGVADRIDFIIGDFFQLAPSLKADVVFLSPPWGGPEYIKAETYDLQTMLKPKDGFVLFKMALSIAPSIVFFLPRTTDPNQLAQLSSLTNPRLACQVERNFVSGELKAITAYYGKIACHDA